MPPSWVQHSRVEWGASGFPRNHITVSHTHVEVHHDVYPTKWDPARHCRAIEDQHLAKGWNGPFYNLGLDRDGELWELRGLGRQSQGTALTVVLFGNYDVDVPDEPELGFPTGAMLDTLVRLVARFPGPIDWHARRAKGTKYASACPGKNAIPLIQVLGQVPTVEEDIMSLFKNESSARTWFVQNAYRVLLGRDPTMSEIQLQSKAVASQGGAAVWHGIANSKEARDYADKG